MCGGGGNAIRKLNDRGLDFHPLSNVVNEPLFQGIDPNLQGTQYEGGLHGGDIVPGSTLYKGLATRGLTDDVLPVAEMFGKAIAGGAVGGAAGGGEGLPASDLEAAGTSAPAAGSSAPSVVQAQSASLQGNAATDTLGGTGSQMPPATPEPAGGPTAPGGSAAPNATMPAAVPEPQGGPTAPGGSAYQPPDATQPAATPADQNNKTPTTTKTVLDSVKTASQILGAVSPLLYAAAGANKAKQQSQQQSPPPPPPPPTLPVFGSGKGPLSAPVVERSIIQDQTARRGRQSTILTNDSNDRLGG